MKINRIEKISKQELGMKGDECSGMKINGKWKN